MSSEAAWAAGCGSWAVADVCLADIFSFACLADEFRQNFVTVALQFVRRSLSHGFGLLEASLRAVAVGRAAGKEADGAAH